VINDYLHFIGLIAGSLLIGFMLSAPLMFVVTIGTHYQLKIWPLSDDYLDKFWAPPRGVYKNPIQWG
jgi:hypothetical protein